MKRLLQVASAFLFLGGAAAAQPTITDVVNAASRIPSGFPGYGIAQGSLFAITGKGLGPDPRQTADYPLPTTGGIAGVTAQVTVGNTTVDAILAYASDTEIGAILPSGTPPGQGVVTVTNNGSTVSAPVTVVASAFGAFSLDYYSGTQSAMAFNVAGDESTTFNYLNGGAGQAAQPGQNVRLSGTGLGAIADDETQPVGAGVPDVQVTLFVGSKQATVVSAGRGARPALPDSFPAYPIPRDLASTDLIEFTVPDGVLGCHVPVTVQTGQFSSNTVWIAISADGGPCTDPNQADFGDTVTFSGTARTAAINLLSTRSRNTVAGLTSEIGTEIGTAQFIQFDVPETVTVPASQFAYAALANNLNPGTCLVQTYRVVTPASPTPTPTPTPAKTVFLDAGAAINLKNPKGAAQKLSQTKDKTYAGSLGSSFNLPGLPSDNSKVFLTPGTFTADNGAGGADVPAFTASVNLPAPVSFDNIDQLGDIVDRSKGVTVKWSGGDPNSYVNIVGSSYNVTGNVTLIGNFVCTERVSAGQFTVPSFVTLALPATKAAPPAPPIGSLSLWSYALNRVQIPTIDLALFSIVMDIQRSIAYQ